jgi:hypothetical protein
MNTTPTTSQVHAPGPRCCLFVFMIDRRFAQRSRNGRAGDADPSATKLGRIRALTPRVCRAAPSWWLGAGETRAIGGQVVRARDFLHPLIRGEFGGDSGEIQGRFRAAFAHRSSFDGPRMQPTLVRCVGRCRMPSMALGGWDRGASGLQKRAAGAAMRAVQHSHTRATR